MTHVKNTFHPFCRTELRHQTGNPQPFFILIKFSFCAFIPFKVQPIVSASIVHNRRIQNIEITNRIDSVRSGREGEESFSSVVIQKLAQLKKCHGLNVPNYYFSVHNIEHSTRSIRHVTLKNSLDMFRSDATICVDWNVKLIPIPHRSNVVQRRN